jgi:phosphoribosylformylglycinamidine synthase
LYLAKVFVTLKPTVNDPQGLTVLGALKTLGFGSVEGVRLGKYLEIKIDETERSLAEQLVSEMCHKLLANLVIEESRFELEELVPSAT